MGEVYKISYVVTGADPPGAILNVDLRPKVGDQISLGNQTFEVTEVHELIPPRGEFHFLHVTLRPPAA